MSAATLCIRHATARTVGVALVAALAISAAAPAQCLYTCTVVAEETCNATTSPSWGTDPHIVVGHVMWCGASGEKAFVWTPRSGLKILPKPPGATEYYAYAAIGPDVVVGRADGLAIDMTPIRWVNGIPEEMPYPRTAQLVEIEGATPSGWVGGSWYEENATWPFLIFGDDFYDLRESVLPEFPYGVEVTGMNDHGTLVAYGIAIGAGETKTDAVVVDWNGNVRVPRPAPWQELYGRDIANDGTVVGWGYQPWPGQPPDFKLKKAFRWSGGDPEELPALPQHNQTVALAANELGHVIGNSEMRFPWGGTDQTTGVIWIDGEVHSLNDLTINNPQPGSLMRHPNRVTPYGTIILHGWLEGQGVGYVLDPIRERDGDVTLDCRVNMKDLSLVLSHWGETCALPHGPGDANGDQEVNARDLAVVLGDWDAP